MTQFLALLGGLLLIAAGLTTHWWLPLLVGSFL